MPKDSDAVMLEKLGFAMVDLEVKFRGSTLSERIEMRPALEELLGDYTRYRLRLLKEGIITTPADLEEMAQIRKEIDRAASKQMLIKAIARTIAFVATKI
jgi:hypothetical protein